MISIAMATYNGARYLEEQINSILLQTERCFELIICDDCSTDNTREIIKRYEKKDSRIHFFENEVNLGYVKNFEKAITLCKGEYIALSDQDDIWLPEHLEVLLNHIKDCKCSLVGGNALLVDSENNDFNCKLINNSNLPEKTEEYNVMILYRNVFQGAAILFERNIIFKAFPFPDNIKYHDWWLALVASEMKGINYINAPILRYRQHGKNVSGDHKKDTFLKKILIFFSSDLYENGIRLCTVLEPFNQITRRKDKVKEVLEYANYCKTMSFNALRYYNKYNKEIYYNENWHISVIRKLKLTMNYIFIKQKKRR